MNDSAGSPGGARGLDLALALVDAAGMGRWRRWAAGRVRGRALELGAGTGRNSSHLPARTKVVAVEPDREALRYRAEHGRGAGPSVAARGEALPFAGGSFDTVLSTLVLCSVEDPDRVAAEIRRVLRPGGRLVGVDHVISPRGWMASAQRRAAPLWCRATGGCHLDRPTVETLQRAGFRVRVLGRRLSGVLVRYLAEVPVEG